VRQPGRCGAPAAPPSSTSAMDAATRGCSAVCSTTSGSSGRLAHKPRSARHLGIMSCSCPQPQGLPQCSSPCSACTELLRKHPWCPRSLLLERHNLSSMTHAWTTEHREQPQEPLVLAGAARAWHGRRRRRVGRAPAARAGPPTRRTGAPPRTASPAQRLWMCQAPQGTGGDMACLGAAALLGGTGMHCSVQGTARGRQS
jgi:hypothetical protein